MSYQEVMALERSIDQEVADRHLRLRLRLDKIRKKKKNQWTRKLADQLVKALTMPSKCLDLGAWARARVCLCARVLVCLCVRVLLIS